MVFKSQVTKNRRTEHVFVVSACLHREYKNFLCVCCLSDIFKAIHSYVWPGYFDAFFIFEAGLEG